MLPASQGLRKKKFRYGDSLSASASWTTLALLPQWLKTKSKTSFSPAGEVFHKETWSKKNQQKYLGREFDIKLQLSWCSFLGFADPRPPKKIGPAHLSCHYNFTSPLGATSWFARQNLHILHFCAMKSEGTITKSQVDLLYYCSKTPLLLGGYKVQLQGWRL